MPRTARQVSETGIYYIFANGEFSKPLTKDNEDKKQLIGEIFLAKKEFAFQVFGFSVTKNELHLMVRESNPLDISQIMKTVFGKYTAYYNSKYKMRGSLLHDRFKSVAMENIDWVKKYLRYIHQAPVKVMEHPNVFTYPFSSYNGYFAEKTNLYINDVLKSFDDDLQKSRTKYKIYHAGVELEELKGTFRHTLTMQDLEEIFVHICGISLEEYSTYKRPEKYEVARTIKKKGKLSYRQMETLLGISRGSLAKL